MWSGVEVNGLALDPGREVRGSHPGHAIPTLGKLFIRICNAITENNIVWRIKQKL